MLEIKNITKIYETGSLRQVALNKVSINFRKNEFAAILGPSGSGKTTLLNIIGGLDKYNNGDLIINNISTKRYKDSDWDSYRNHRIGFVFQNYNLISHQTVLKNVSLALTISGISKKETVERAKQALISVGLEDHMFKRPNQLSGGQMQRVAIARALVNNPDIVLADEPTGALDSETSLQIMDILKDVAKDRLVIMVTHNPDLAETYANRIIKLKDGKIISDSNPYNGKNKEEEIFEKTKRTGMSYFTALGLSFSNLMTKKGRTVLTALAGSIGIIGIALILSLSTGFQNYIDKIQEDTMSSYPLTITSETADMTSLLMSMISDDNKDNEEIQKSNKLVEKQFVSEMFGSVSKNDLKSFKRHIEKNNSKLEKDITAINYIYSVDPVIYTRDYKDDVIQVNPNSMFSSMYGNMGASSLFSSYSSMFYQMIDDTVTLNEQYDVVAGHWPEKYNEMVMVLSQDHMIPDFILYFLGYRDMEELYDVISKVMSGEDVDLNNEPMEITYDDILNIEFKLVNPSDKYKFNSKYDIYEDMSEDEKYMENIYNKSEKLKIVGIAIRKEGVNSMTLSPGIAYKKELINHIIDKSKNSKIVQKQLTRKDIDVFSGKKFDSDNKKNDLDFEDMITVDRDMLSSAFGMNISEEDIKNITTSAITEISSDITADTSGAKKAFEDTLVELSNNMFDNALSSGKVTIHMSEVDSYMSEFLDSDETKKKLSDLEEKYVVPSSAYLEVYRPLLKGIMTAYIQAYNGIDSSQTTDQSDMGALISKTVASPIIDSIIKSDPVKGTVELMGTKMTEAVMQKEILTEVGNLSATLVTKIASGFNVKPEKIAAAFKFNLSEDELRRLMSAMMGGDNTSSAQSNLLTLGYQDREDPTMISIYFKDFDAKERVLKFIDDYNDAMEKLGDEDKLINYSDTAGLLMSSVKKIINSISYALMAFVSISLVVSSIMIGIITYISVLERTKEIGILRAIGSSKRNISSIFNAETFIIGLLSGLFGIGITLALIPVINYTIHTLTDNYDINAVLPIVGAVSLILLSIILTIIGGLIPSKKASRQDPVIALRTE